MGAKNEEKISVMTSSIVNDFASEPETKIIEEVTVFVTEFVEDGVKERVVLFDHPHRIFV